MIFMLSQIRAPAVIATGSSDPKFRILQPCEVIRAPEPKEVKAIVPNTKKLIAAWALSRSSGR